YEGQTPLDTLISDANGFFKVINLLLTDYWIVETKAPSRYTAFINPIKFTVSKGDSLASPAIPTTLANSDNYGAWENGLVSLVDDDDEDLIKTDLHHNIPNAVGDGELPATGGRGFWYILLASLVAFTIMATFYFIRRKAQVVHEDRHDDV
ncbi:MAG: prealbumin-like fold domain-containing protein, partial [Streptococcaceae bacterium]|nr:prealbumin-like fold domain-containing protein [Streptococcaceae bacterium]